MNIKHLLSKNKYVFCSCILLGVFVVLTILPSISFIPEPFYPIIQTDEGSYNLASYLRVSNQHIGQVNHFRDIVFNAPLTDFEGMEPKLGANILPFGPGGDAGLRYMLAFSTYALAEFALRTPGYRYYYQTLIDRYIQKMQTIPVMEYWNQSSDWYGGKSYYQYTVDEYGVPPGDFYGLNYTNIMYRGHWLLMMVMYKYLFNDTKYDVNMTWQLDSLYDEMMNASNPILAYHGIPGVPCEPNDIFTQCNSIQQLAFSIYDKALSNVSDPTNYTDASDKFVAWELENATNSKGLFVNGMNVKNFKNGQPYVTDPDSGYTQAWTLAFMRGFNKSIADQLYPIYEQYHVKDTIYPAIVGGLAFVKEDAEMDPLSTDIFQIAFSVAASAFGMVCANEFGDYATRDKFLNLFTFFFTGAWEGNEYFYRTPLFEGLQYAFNMFTFWGSQTGVSLSDFTTRRPASFFDQPYISTVSDPRNIFINQAIYDESKTAFMLTCTALTPGTITISNLNASSAAFSIFGNTGLSVNSGNLTINVQPGIHNFVIENR